MATFEVARQGAMPSTASTVLPPRMLGRNEPVSGALVVSDGAGCRER
jgi:hypothetical protein